LRSKPVFEAIDFARCQSGKILSCLLSSSIRG
jgi:hypothetical protein